MFEYDALSTESQDTFRRLLAQRHVTRDAQLFGPDIADEYYNLINNRYNRSVVTIRHQSQYREQTCLVDVEPADEEPANGAAHVQYSSLSADGQTLFRSVLDVNATSNCFAPAQYPIDPDYQYITYNGTAYSVITAHATETEQARQLPL